MQIWLHIWLHVSSKIVQREISCTKTATKSATNSALKLHHICTKSCSNVYRIFSLHPLRSVKIVTTICMKIIIRSCSFRCRFDCTFRCRFRGILWSRNCMQETCYETCKQTCNQICTKLSQSWVQIFSKVFAPRSWYHKNLHNNLYAREDKIMQIWLQMLLHISLHISCNFVINTRSWRSIIFSHKKSRDSVECVLYGVPELLHSACGCLLLANSKNKAFSFERHMRLHMVFEINISFIFFLFQISCVRITADLWQIPALNPATKCASKSARNLHEILFECVPDFFASPSS